MIARIATAVVILVGVASTSFAAPKRDQGAMAKAPLINTCAPGHERDWDPICYRRGWFWEE